MEASGGGGCRETSLDGREAHWGHGGGSGGTEQKKGTILLGLRYLETLTPNKPLGVVPGLN